MCPLLWPPLRRTEFRVWHDKDELYYIMFEKVCSGARMHGLAGSSCVCAREQPVEEATMAVLAPDIVCGLVGAEKTGAKGVRAKRWKKGAGPGPPAASLRGRGGSPGCAGCTAPPLGSAMVAHGDCCLHSHTLPSTPPPAPYAALGCRQGAEGEQRQVRVDRFPVASELVNQLMELVLREAKASPLLRTKLYQVGCRSWVGGGAGRAGGWMDERAGGGTGDGQLAWQGGELGGAGKHWQSKVTPWPGRQGGLRGATPGVLRPAGQELGRQRGGP